MNRAPLHCVCFLCLLTFGVFHQAEAAAHNEGFDPVSVTARNAYQESLKENEFLQKIFKKYGTDGKMTFEGFQELLERLGLGEVRIAQHEAMIVSHEGNKNSTALVVDTIGDNDHVHYPHKNGLSNDGHHSDHQNEESSTSQQDSDHSDHSHVSAMPGEAHDHHEEPTETIKVPQSVTTTVAPVPAAVQEALTPRPGRQSSSRRQRRKGKRRQRRRGRRPTAVPATSSLDLMEGTAEPLRRGRRDAASSTGKEDEKHHDGHDHDDHEEEDEHGHGDHDHNHDDHDHGHEDHDHEHEDHDHGHEDHDQGHEDHDHEDHDHDHGDEDHDHGHEDHDHGHEDHDHGHEDHDHGHEDHDHGHEDHDHGDEDHDHGHKDHDHEGHDHHGHAPGAHCLSAREILIEYHIPPGMSVMTMPDFVNICPLLISQIDEQACIVHEEDGHDHGDHDEHKAKQGLPAAVWGYGILAVTVISILAVLGIVLLPFMEQRVYQFLLCFLVALAVGTLTGDAVLHLLPHSLGLHAHDEEDGHEGHEGHQGHDEGHDEGSHLDPVLKGLTVLFGIYFLFIMEKLMGVMTKRRAKRKARKLRKQRELAHPGESYELKSATDSPTEDDHCHHHHHHHHHDNEKLKDAGIATMAWMVIMGDGLHNFSDGMAIGAAFASGIPGGVSTSIAVFCHELPHELGDFALLIRAGMSVKQAILYNLMSACICYIGLLIGLGIGNLSGNVIQYVFAATAGMFLYVGLVDMLPDMVHPNQPQVIAEPDDDEHDHGEHGHGEHGHGEHGHGHSHVNNIKKKKQKETHEPASPVLVQSFGLLVGIGIMLLIAVFEDQIKI